MATTELPAHAPTAVARSWRQLVGVLSAQAFSWTGTRLSAVALPWFVLTTTGSPARTGLVVFAEMGPYVLGQLLSGPVIDRVGARRVSLVGDVVSMLAVAVVPIGYATGLLRFWLLVVAVVIVGAARGPGDAAKLVLVPHATARAAVPLERGMGIAGTIERLASTVGPALAAVTIALLGGPYGLVVTSVLFGLGGLVIATTVTGGRTTRSATSSYRKSLGAGARQLWSDRLQRSIALMMALTNLLDGAWIAVLLPEWARDSGRGASVVGLLVGAMSAGAVVSGIVAAAVAHRLPRRPAYLIGYVLGGAPRFLVLAFGLPLWCVAAVFVASGLATGFVNPIIGVVQFEHSPAGLYARVRSMVTAVAWSGVPFGGLVGGGLVVACGLPATLVACAVAYGVGTVIPGLNRGWTVTPRQRAAPPAVPRADRPST